MTTETLPYGNHPALRKGLAIIPVTDGLIIEGGDRRQHFTGAAATDVLGRLFPLLDGSTKVSSLSAQLGVTDDHVRQMLGLLAGLGFLEPEASEGDEETHVYLSRTTSVSYRSGNEARRFLGQLNILLATGPDLGARIAADLTASGVGSVGLLCTGLPEDCDLVVAYDDGHNLSEIVELCGPRGIPVLRCSSQAEMVEVGPKFGVGNTPCPSCLKGSDPIQAPAAIDGPVVDHIDLVSALVVTEVLATFGVGGPSNPHVLRRVQTGDLSEERFVVAPEADCDHCGGYAHVHGGVADLFLSYEWQVQATSWDLDRAEFQPAAPSPKRLLSEAADYASHPRCRLSDLSNPMLASLLSKTAGLQGGTNRRWAPTGGDLRSVDLFLISDTPPADLPGNIFRYLSETDELVAARRDRVSMTAMFEGTGLVEEGLIAAVVFCGSLWRLTAKYERFSCRLALLDAGCAAAQFSVMAQEYGLEARYAAGWDGRLTAALELDGRREFVTAVAGLYPKD
ncbi:hypothetical protein ACGFW5_13625 [Streptomyces sp. NPDC048416]|uniref:hypothetical protein n=1 Tax=Streptomyces sp. NPDC048416 TaxID=3365546 RepID=UPI003717391D